MIVSATNNVKPQGRVMPVLRKAAKTAVLALPIVVTSSLYYAGAQMFNLPLIRRTPESMLPTLYGSAMVSGLWIGGHVSTEKAADNGVDPKKAGMAYYLTGAAGIFGAKFLGMAMGISTWSQGGIWYGGALGGLAALAIFSKVAKIPFLKLSDPLTPGGLIGVGIGRGWGCYTAGCCAGEVFGLHLEPLAAIFNIGLGLWLNKMSQNISGRILALGIGIHGIFRFITEFSRHEYVKDIVFANLTLSQIISMLLVTAAGVLYTKHKNSETAPIEKPKPVKQTPKQNFKRSIAELFAFMPLWYIDKPSTIIVTLINLIRTIAAGVKWGKSGKNEAKVKFPSKSVDKLAEEM